MNAEMEKTDPQPPPKSTKVPGEKAVRLKEKKRIENPRKRYPSDDPSRVKARKENYKRKCLTCRGCLEFTCESESDWLPCLITLTSSRNISGVEMLIKPLTTNC